MPGTLWTKWYWSDWANDPALRLCSLAAQGMWMRMLCIAAEADPIGYVTVNGRPLDGQDLARIAGVSVPEAETLLAELDRNGVFSRDRNGTCYSRRMIRDAKRAKISRKNGKEGGNPALRKQRGNSARDNPPDNVGLKTHKPRARSQIPEDTPLNTENNQNTVGLAPDGVLNVIAFDGEARNGRYPPAFEELWREYGPISQPSASKAKAFQAWRKLTPGERAQCWDGLVSYVLWVREQRRTRTDFPAKHLATFVNGRGWEPFIEQQQEVAGWTPH